MSKDAQCRPTIECPCDRSMFRREFTYVTPPTGETAFDWSGQNYRRGFDRCLTCGHWFGAHSLMLQGLYQGEYAQSTYGDRMQDAFDRIIRLPRTQSDNAGRRDRLIAFAKDHSPSQLRPTLLDIGSGLGVFPYVMKEAGWLCTALDPDPRACAHIANRVDVPTIQADFLSVALGSIGSYDVVTLNKVIEHVEDPCAILRRVRKIVKTGGFVYVEVPDGDAAAIEGAGREEFFVEHYHLFSPASLSGVVERAGFQVERLYRLREPSGKFSLVCFAVPGNVQEWRIDR